MIEEKAIQMHQLAKANAAASSSTPIAAAAAAAAIHMGLAAQNHKTHSSAALCAQCLSCNNAIKSFSVLGIPL